MKQLATYRRKVHDEISGQAREMPIQNRMRHVRIFAHTAGMSMMTSTS